MTRLSSDFELRLLNTNLSDFTQIIRLNQLKCAGNDNVCLINYKIRDGGLLTNYLSITSKVSKLAAAKF